MRIENSAGWPYDQWPRFIELLRAFCLSDAEQDAFFPDLQGPRYHASTEGDGYTLCSYSSAFSEVYDLAGSSLLRSDEPEDEVLSRISTLFRLAWDEVLEPVLPRKFPCAPRTNHAALERMRSQLRALCLKSLVFWNEEVRPPTSSWEELVM